MGREKERLANALPVSELGLSSTSRYGGPKKQYVREHGWRDIISAFIDQRKADGYDFPIKYLTFPGANATDIGVLYKSGLLKVHDGKLQVAICDRDNALTIQNSLRETIGEVLVATTKDLHVALKDEDDDLVQAFPFDVINCDFFDTALKCIPTEDSYPNIESINKIFEYQLGKDFLLLLTARAMAKIHEDIFSVIADNLEVGAFKAEYIKLYGKADPHLCADHTNDAPRFSLLVYSKLVARFAKKFGFKISDKFSAQYERHGKEGVYHMVAMSFLLESQSRSTQKKYEPKFTKRNMLLGGNNVPDYMLQKATEHYDPYVVRLLDSARTLDISRLLANDPKLLQKYEANEKKYDHWWNQR